MQKISRYLSFILLVIVVFSIGSFAASDGSYSTEDDPLVSLSYVNSLKEQIVNELYEKADSDSLADYLKSTSYTYEHLTKGQKIVATGSCEIVLRSGKGICIISDEKNISTGVGLSDLTAGVELKNGATVPTNHQLLASAGDGRMIEVTSSDGYFMARGDYCIVG